MKQCVWCSGICVYMCIYSELCIIGACEHLPSCMSMALHAHLEMLPLLMLLSMLQGWRLKLMKSRLLSLQNLDVGTAKYALCACKGSL